MALITHKYLKHTSLFIYTCCCCDLKWSIDNGVDTHGVSCPHCGHHARMEEGGKECKEEDAWYMNR